MACGERLLDHELAGTASGSEDYQVDRLPP